MTHHFKGYARNAGYRWRGDDLKRLRTLARKGLAVREIGLEIGRPDAAVRAKLREIGWAPRRHAKACPAAPPAANEAQLELFDAA